MIAATADPFASAQGVFLQYGVVGALALMLLWFSYGAIKRERDNTDRERARAEKAESEKDELNRLMRAEVIPVLTKATEATTRVTEVVGRVTDVLADVSLVLRDRR